MKTFRISDLNRIIIYDAVRHKELFTFSPLSRSVLESSEDKMFTFRDGTDSPILQEKDLSLPHPFFVLITFGSLSSFDLFIPITEEELKNLRCIQKRGNRGTILFVQGQLEHLVPPMRLDVSTYESSELYELNDIYGILERLMDSHEDEPFETDYDEKDYLSSLMHIKELADKAITHAKWRLAISDEDALGAIRDWDDRRRWC